MKHYLLSAISLVSVSVYSQNAAPAQKQKIADSGFAAALLAEPDSIQKLQNKDGSLTWTVHFHINNYTFRMVLIKSNDNGLTTRSAQEKLLLSQLDEVRKQYSIAFTEGYQPGEILKDDSDVHGISDFWYDKSGNRYSVKGWVMENYMAILTVNGNNELPPYKLCRDFFNGLEFPM